MRGLLDLVRLNKVNFGNNLPDSESELIKLQEELNRYFLH